MRTFQLTVHGTVVAPTEEDAIALVRRVLPESLGGAAVPITGAEIGDQICAECWCYVDADSQVCDDCAREAAVS